MKAIWKGQILAESDETHIVENNHYFPPESIHEAYFKESKTQSHCPWKGTASYYTIEVDGQQHVDAAWYYPKTREAAKGIEGYVAFWKEVVVTD